MSSPKNHLGRLGTWRERIRGSWRRHGGAAAEARRQEALAALAQRALEGADSKDLLTHASALAARILDVPYAAVFAWQPDGRSLRVVAGVGWHAGVVGRAFVDATAHPDTATAWLGLDAHAFEALEATPGMRAVPLLRGHDIVSGLSVAMVPRGRAYGVFGVYASKRRRFRPAEVDFVRGVARLLAIALGREYGERALFEEMEMSTVLSHVGRELMACSDVDELLARSCQLNAQALRCEQSVTWLRRAEDDEFRAAASEGIGADLWDTLRRATLGAASVAPMLAELAVRDAVRVTPSDAASPELGAILQRCGIRAAIFAPIRNGEQVVGLQMSGHVDRAGEFRAQDDRVASGIAQLASTALVNARVVEELERASQLKSEFVSTMSHELRTPLNIIIGYTEMLVDAVSLDDQAPLLAQIQKASHDLFELIDGTLSLNRLAAGGDVARFASVRVGELCRELEAELAPRIAEAAVTLLISVPETLEIPTDRRKLKIVLKNLLSNALKFTAVGNVVVAAEPVGDRCRLTVRDTGIGIAPEVLPHVFEMFRQGDGSETRSYGGAGLGLFIVKSLLTQLGGDVQAESIPGQGSIFTVVLPLASPETITEDGDAASAVVHALPVADADECALHAPRRLVFADDLPLNRILVERFVTKEFPNVRVLEAGDGEEAVAMVERERPHLVLLDLHMPKLDGWQAASAIRRLPGGSKIPVIALSVDASPNAEAKAVRAGFQEFIAKPISDYSALKARLTHWLLPRDERGNPQPQNPHPRCELCRAAAAAEDAVSAA